MASKLTKSDFVAAIRDVLAPRPPLDTYHGRPLNEVTTPLGCGLGCITLTGIASCLLAAPFVWLWWEFPHLWYLFAPFACVYLYLAWQCLRWWLLCGLGEDDGFLLNPRFWQWLALTILFAKLLGASELQIAVSLFLLLLIPFATDFVPKSRLEMVQWCLGSMVWFGWLTWRS